ncbi:purple acid phosphatase family protein [Pirellulimonas nuda]|nr:metallophosphoesterase family protein [Pirellulimonas nuda]
MATPDSMVVVWRTRGPSAPSVRFGDSPETLSHAVEGEAITRRASVGVDGEFASRLYREPAKAAARRDRRDPSPSTPPGLCQYEVRLTGLKPGTRYYYAVYDGDRRLAGGDPEHTFTTSPPPGSDTDLRVWVVGDSGTGGSDQRRVYKAMQGHVRETGRPLDLYLHLGDMAYGDGTDPEFQKKFFDVYQPTLRQMVCWPTMGNHEGHTSRGARQFGPYYDAYVAPTAAEAGGVASGTEAYYAFDIAGVHFICLDSHDLDRTPGGAMARWLQADLDEARAEWLIAFWHHPPYTKGSHDSDTEGELIEMRTHIMPILESAGVDLVLAGHSHIYERSMLIDGAYATPTVAEGVVLDDGDGDPDGDGPYRKSAGLHPNEGTVAVVSGHGGAGVGRKGTMPIMRQIIVENGSLLLDIKGDELTGTMINKAGETSDRFRIVKRGQVQQVRVEDPWRPSDDPSQYTEFYVAWDGAARGEPTAGWDVTPATADAVRVEEKSGKYRQARFQAADAPLTAIAQRFSGPVSHIEVQVRAPADQEEAVGVVLGYQGPDDYFVYRLHPAEKAASLSRRQGGVERELTRKAVEADFSKMVKISLEPVADILEVQLNGAQEYTINLDAPLPPGAVGLRVEAGGSADFAGIGIEPKQ